jgi:hypothetical protein
MKPGPEKTHAPRTPVELPGRSETVILNTASGGRIPGRVLESGPDTLLIAVVVPIRPFTDSDLDSLVIQFNNAHGRIRVRGVFAVEDRNEPDLLRLVEPRSVEVLQEREYVRIKAARPVFVTCGGTQVHIRSYTADISGGGLLLAGPDTLKVGDEVQFQLTISSGAHPINGTGRVVRIDLQGRRAVAFEQISDLDRRRLVRFIFECQRAERQRGLQKDDGDGR